MDESRRTTVVALIISFQVLAWITLVARLCIRHFMVKRMGLDDAFIAVAMLPVCAHAVLQLLSCKEGLGLHITDVDPSKFVPIFRYLWSSAIPFNLSHLFIKLSYLALYLRLLPYHQNRMAVFAAMAVIVAGGIAFTLTAIFMCTPIQRGWDGSVPGTCINTTAWVYVNTVYNMVTDVLVFVLPIRTLWSLHLPRRQRIVLAGTFSCGIIILLASALRIVALVVFNTHPEDPTWHLGPVIIWSETEVHLAIILACAPAIKVLMQAIFPGFMASLVSKSATKKSRGQTHNSAYVLQSMSHGDDEPENFQTVIHASKPSQKDSDSQEHIVQRSGPVTAWPQVETTITVHSSAKE